MEFEVSTVSEAGLSGLKNGKLLKAAVEINFDILLTIDKNIGYQQNVGSFPHSSSDFRCNSQSH